MIYDCFLFHNELELLEIRLEELDPYVDRFVIACSLQTHSGNKRVPILLENRDRFEKFWSKIDYVLFGHLRGNTPMERQAYQRNTIFGILAGCADDDLIMLSDIDEIPKGSSISKFDPSRGIGIFQQEYRYYYLNGILPGQYWKGTTITTYKFLKEELGGSLQKLREYGHPVFGHPDMAQFISNGGWHFTFLGGEKRVIEKIRSFGAQQFNTDEITNAEWVRQAIDLGIDVLKRHFYPMVKYNPIDDQLPEIVIKNQEKYKELIKT